ncbi:unnamed protein product [Ilex paraguariensis]|uniref:Uncharacterized protein n=1 Tax=Ilex paraguariensis TaxID=185542 RepID=A0ABC8UBR7_9AQUA
MALQDTLRLQPLFSSVIEKRIGDFPFSAGTCPRWRKRKNNTIISSSSMKCRGLSSPNFFKPATGFRRSGLRASKLEQILESANGNEQGGGESSGSDVEDDPLIMDEDERKEWRRKIREVIDMNPDVEEELDAIERRKRMEKLLADYPLVVEEDDPDWPEDADGWGFNLGQFFNKITIKNAKKDDDENYDSENELVWQDDDYIRPIKDINTKEWEETVFKDISPLILLVHNRYKRLVFVPFFLLLCIPIYVEHFAVSFPHDIMA